MTQLPPAHDTEAWQQLGADAYRRGDFGIPALSPEIQAAISDMRVGEGAAALMRAWLDGWAAAHNAATDKELHEKGRDQG